MRVHYFHKSMRPGTSCQKEKLELGKPSKVKKQSTKRESNHPFRFILGRGRELATNELTFEDFEEQSMAHILPKAQELQVCHHDDNLGFEDSTFVASLRKIHVCNGTNKKDLCWTGVTTCSCSMFQFNL